MDKLLKFKKYISVVCCSLIIIACNNHNRNFRYVQTIPDSLRTEEEKIIAHKLIEVLVQDTYVQDNKVALKSSKSDFKSKGIPLEYFNKLKDDIKITNKYLNSNKVNNMQELVDSLKSNLKSELEK